MSSPDAEQQRRLHHQFNNHLQGAVGLISNRLGKDPECNRVLQEAVSYLKCIALVHSIKSRDTNAHVALSTLIRGVLDIAAPQARFNAPALAAASQVHLADEFEVPLVLVLNEIIANAGKHCDSADHG